MTQGQQAAIESRRRWRAAHPEYKSRGSSNEQRKARYAHVTAINPCYLKEARAMLQGKDTRFKNRCQKLPGDD